MIECEIVRPPRAEVHLVGWTGDPASVVATVARTYTGNLAPAYPTSAETLRTLQDLQKTALATPLEFVHFTFLVEGVTRAFTHQIVRYRIGASYAQESLRFLKRSKLQVLDTLTPGSDEDTIYRATVHASVATFASLLLRGVPCEEARNILPHGVLTSIFVDWSFRTLLNVWRQRFSGQEQPTEWHHVLFQMRDAIDTFDSDLASLLTLDERGRNNYLQFKASWDRSV